MADYNKPHLMGNCEHCYYATDASLVNVLLEKGKFYFCHRYPDTAVRVKESGDYCGEFAWKHDVQNVGDA